MKDLFPGQFHFSEEDLSFLPPLREQRKEQSLERGVKKKAAKKKRTRKTKGEKILSSLTPEQRKILGC